MGQEHARWGSQLLGGWGGRLGQARRRVQQMKGSLPAGNGETWVVQQQRSERDGRGLWRAEHGCQWARGGKWAGRRHRRPRQAGGSPEGVQPRCSLSASPRAGEGTGTRCSSFLGSAMRWAGAPGAAGVVSARDGEWGWQDR